MRKLVLVVALVAVLGGGGFASLAPLFNNAKDAVSTARDTLDQASSATDPASGLPIIKVSKLPKEAKPVLAAIKAGGPFEYPGKDGSTFGNYEGLLPKESRGYYREYTVDTPGSSDRGTRRIIAGKSGELYWTADHYEHFSRIQQ